jgi:hypothetical protein
MRKEHAHACGFRNGAVERDYRSDVEERGTADRRTRNGKRRVDRFRHDRRLGKTAGGKRDNWISASRWNAACQVFDDLALEAIVIVRMRRAAGDLGRIVMSMGAGVLVGVVVRNAAIGAMLIGCEIDEPRQRSDRRPNEREQYVRGEPRAPTPSSEPPVCHMVGHRQRVTLSFERNDPTRALRHAPSRRSCPLFRTSGSTEGSHRQRGAASDPSASRGSRPA